MRWLVPPETTADGEAPGALEALLARFPALADPGATALAARFATGEIVDADGRAWGVEDPVRPGDELWFHRELRPESIPEVELPVLHLDDHLLVIDKPHDMATMPRGAHVLSSALVRLRRETGIETLAPLHRLDRRTAGVLAFGIRPEGRPAYQKLFADRDVDKEYEALVAPTAACTLALAAGERTVLRDRLVKERGELRTQVLPGEPNAETVLEVLSTREDDVRHLRLAPRTGRTHQLRAQLAARGAPILGEDLYPDPVPESGMPLQLLARRLAFEDPLTAEPREFTSARELIPGSRTLSR